DPLLQLLAVVVGRRLFDLLVDLVDPRLDVLRPPGAVDDRRVLLRDLDLLRLAQVVERRLLERQADLLGDHLAAGQDRDVLQHRLAAVAEARRLDGRDLHDAADVVHDQRRERLALDVLSDDQQRAARLRDRLEQRQEIPDVRDLLVVNQDVRVLELGRLALLIVDEVRREVAAVELHTLDDLELVLEARAFLDRDHAFLADLAHRLGDDAADLLVRVRRDRADLRDGLVVLARLRHLLELLGQGLRGAVHAPLQVHRVEAGRDLLQALTQDRLREHSGRRRAVAGGVGRLRGHFLDHLDAHVLELVLELDLLRDRHAVLRDGRRAEALLEHDVAAFRAECHLDGVREDVYAAQHALARLVGKSDFFRSRHVSVSVPENACANGCGRQAGGPQPSITAMTSSSRMTRSSSPSTLTSVPEYLPNSTLSPSFSSSLRTSPLSRILPCPTAMTSPRIGFSAAVSGITIPPGEVRSSSVLLITTRSCKGRSFMGVSL